MECPKCGKGTCVLVTKDVGKVKKDREGWAWWIILWPFRLIRFLWRLLFGRSQRYHKKQMWHCNYCGKDFPDKPEEE